MFSDVKTAVDYIRHQFHTLTGQECFYLSMQDIEEERDGLLAHNPFCAAITGDEVGLYLCRKKRTSVLNHVVTQRKPHYSICHAGVVEAAVPVLHEDVLQGVLMCFVLTYESNANIELHSDHYLTKFNMEADDFSSALLSFQRTGEHQLDAMVGLLDSLVRVNLKSGERLERPVPSPMLDELSADDISDNRAEQYNPEPEPGEGGFFSLYPYMRPKMKHSFDDAIHSLNSTEGFRATIEVREKIINSIYYDIRAGHLLNAKERYKSLFQFTLMQNDIALIHSNVLIIASQLYRSFMMHQANFEPMQQLLSGIFGRAMLAEDVVRLRDIVSDLYDGLVEIYSVDQPNINAIINRMKEYMEANYMNQISIEKLAQKYKISVSYASHEFKKQMRISAKAYLNEIRMDNAQRLLRDTDLSISDIAESVGYTDIRSFYKMFSKHFSVTCTQMRNFTLQDGQRGEENAGPPEEA